MWDLALNAAVYAYNRTPHKSNNMEIPLMKFAPNRNFDINQLKRFGCLAYVKIQRKTGPKFDRIGIRTVLIGYTITGYILLDPTEGRFYESRHVRFNEKMVYKNIYKKDDITNWEKTKRKIDKQKFLTDFEEEPLHETETQEGENIVKRQRGRPRKIKTTEDCNKTVTVEQPEKINSPIVDSSFSGMLVAEDLNKSIHFGKENFTDNEEHDDRQSKQAEDEAYYALMTNISRDPSSYKQAMKSKEKHEWNQAIYEELKSMEKNNVWKIVDRPKNDLNGKKPNIIDSRWVLKKKNDSTGNIKFKARLVVRGFKDKNNYDLMDIYAPVSRLALVRSVLAIINKFDLETRQLDVKTAFLNGTIKDEIYMEVPDGVTNAEKLRKTKVCKLEKALYGLKISPKRWNEKFTEAAIKIGLKNQDNEPCLFTWRQDERFLILLLYVDDMLIASNDSKKLNEIKTKLQNEFEMTDMGEVKIFLGIEINRDKINKIIRLTQEQYTCKILKRFGFDECKPCKTPMVTNQVLNRQRREREETEDSKILEKNSTPANVPYREAVGSLLYLANTVRPDIAYPVNVLSRHQLNPTEEDWKMVKRVFRYLQGTKDSGLTFKASYEGLEAFSDASFADCKGSLTTSGYVVRLFGDAIAWRTHKQNYVSLSTCQAEYISMSEACQELMAIKNSISIILKDRFTPMNLWCDNRPAKICAETNGGKGLRHMSRVHEHFVKECVKLNTVKLIWITSKDQLADIFTKPLPIELHEKLTGLILND